MENLSFVMVNEEKFNNIQSSLNEIKSILTSKNEEKEKSKWVSKVDARKRLNVCQKTLDTYLKNGVIAFSRFAGKIYIKSSDIEAHLEKHYVINNE